MKNINDSVFGEMSFDYGWRKKEKINFYGREYEIDVIAASYNDTDEITDEQRNSYSEYKNSNLDKLSKALLNYYIEMYDDYIEPYITITDKYKKDVIDEETVVKLIKPTSLLIKEDGKYGLVCDCAWDKEHGIVIILSNDEPIVTNFEELM